MVFPCSKGEIVSKIELLLYSNMKKGIIKALSVAQKEKVSLRC